MVLGLTERFKQKVFTDSNTLVSTYWNQQMKKGTGLGLALCKEIGFEKNKVKFG